MQNRKVETVIVGAGIAGLSCVRAFRSQGREVLIVERSRALGGRCATWRHDDVPLDYGVPFLHGRSSLLWETIEELMPEEVLSGWPKRVEGEGPTCQPRALDDGVRRAALRGGMNLLAKKLADGVEIMRESDVTGMEIRGGAVELTGDGFSITAQALVLAAANGQSRRLLTSSGFSQEMKGADALFGLAPHLPSMSLLVCYDDPGWRPDWDLLLPGESDAIQLISNENSKGRPQHNLCLNIQARPPWSRKRLDMPAEEWARELLIEAQPYLGAWALKPDWQRPHRWEEARLDNASRLTQPLLKVIDGCPVGVTGEYFDRAGGLEGAFLAGRRLAELIMETK